MYVQETASSVRQARVIAQFELHPEDVYDQESHHPLPSVSQYIWSSDSKRLLYTEHSKSGMDLAVLTLANGRKKTLLSCHEGLELRPLSPGENLITIKSFDTAPLQEKGFPPDDFALLMKTGYRFDLSLNNPKTGHALVTESWRYHWGDKRATRINNTRVEQYWPFPDEYVWNGQELEMRYRGTFPGEVLTATTAAEKPDTISASVDIELETNPEGTTVSVKRAGVSRSVYRENALLIAHYAEQTDKTRKTYLSKDGHTAVLLKSTNLEPDELVELDLETGKMVSLFTPNEQFRDLTKGIEVRYIPIPVADEKLNGRLFLPADYDTNTRYPLVFTTYLSTPGFNLGSGEVPILPLVENGILVFALDARESNEVGQGGDFTPELRRLQRPCEAMEWVIRKLSDEGVIDPQRVGVSGLSYGTEISMYVYWKSKMFRTVSATTGSWEPVLYYLGGIGWGGYLRGSGFPDPETEGLSKWKEIAAGSNAHSTLPPLLWQAPDEERLWNVESWFKLRQAGAQVEWLEYPNEGHVKRSPADIWWVQQRNLDWFRFWLRDEEDRDPGKTEQYVRWREMRRNWEIARAGAIE
jgi:hypothetical protein